MNVLDTPQLQITVSRQVAIELLSGLSAANPGSAAPPTESAAEILGIPDGSCNADDPVTIFANAVDAITCNKARLWVQESSHRPVVLQLASNNQCVIRGIQVECMLILPSETPGKVVISLYARQDDINEAPAKEGSYRHQCKRLPLSIAMLQDSFWEEVVSSRRPEHLHSHQKESSMTSMRLLLLNAAFYLGLLAAPFKPDLAKSNVTIVFKQLNVPVEAKFKQLNAVIDFNRAQPETSKASVEIAFQASIWATPNTTRKC